MSTLTYRCLIVDDEALARDLIAGHLDKLSQFEVVAACANAIDASRVLATESVDLLFLDIEMPALKGTDFLRGVATPPAVIFTTAYREYAVDGFELEAVDYLLKPITFPRFFRAVERFLARQAPTELTAQAPAAGPTALFVRVDRKDMRIPFSEILFVRGLKDYVQIHTRTRDRVYTAKETMGSLAERLGPEFVRVHRSYIVNRQRVTAVTRHDVELGDMEIPLGETYREAALHQLGAS